MFEQELEMEKTQSSVVPLLLIVVLILAIVGVAGYYVIENRKVLSNAEATLIASKALEGQGPATTSFHTGVIKSSVNDNPANPQYRVLEKTGYLSLGKMRDYKTPVALTAKGEELLKKIPGATQTEEADGTKLVVIPVATRKLVSIDKITMTGTGRARVDISWKWDPNELGDLFDAAGPTLKTLSTWDRMAMIQKHGADFYHADATKVTLLMAKGKNGWDIALPD